MECSICYNECDKNYSSCGCSIIYCEACYDKCKYQHICSVCHNSLTEYQLKDCYTLDEFSNIIYDIIKTREKIYNINIFFYYSFDHLTDQLYSRFTKDNVQKFDLNLDEFIKYKLNAIKGENVNYFRTKICNGCYLLNNKFLTKFDINVCKYGKSSYNDKKYMYIDLNINVLCSKY